MGELAIAWLLAEPSLGTVPVGATRPEQLNLPVSAADWRLTPEERCAVDEIQE